MRQGHMEIFRPRDPRVFVKEEELKGLGSLVELCDRVVLFRHQTLDDNIKVRNLSQQKSHVGQVIGACDEAEDVFNVSWIKNLVRFIASYLQPSLDPQNFAHLKDKLVFMQLVGFL